MRLTLLARGTGIAILSAPLLAPLAQANTGRIEFVSGQVTVRNAQGDRPLARGAEVRTGDTVLTSEGRAQIKFPDGGFISLQPNTEFSVEKFEYNGKPDGTESAVFGLVKGAMRTVTGLVGRLNKDKFQIRTPSATIGIRGTGGVVAVINGVTSIIGTSGVWVMTNQSGTIEIPAGRVGVAGPDQSKPPQRGSTAPQTPTSTVAAKTQEQQQEQQQEDNTPTVAPAENRTSTGASVVSQTAIVFDPTRPVAVSFAEVQSSSVTALTLTDGTITGSSVSVRGLINTSGHLTGFTFLNKDTKQKIDWTFVGTLNEAGADGVMSWGRWTGAATVVSSTDGRITSSKVGGYGTNGGFHYVQGTPTATMPTTGNFTGTLVGHTAPTVNTEAFAPGSVQSGTLTGTFTPTGGTFSAGLNYRINSVNYALSASGNITGNQFSGTGTNTGGACTSCTASVTGGFAGVDTTHAGMAYRANLNNAGSLSAAGTAAFRLTTTRAPESTTRPSLLTTGGI